LIIKIKTPEALRYFQTLKNRTIWEEEIANEYFWPFKHQEACRGEDFDRRSNWSFTLCDKGKDLYLEVLAESLADYQLPKSGIIQDEVRELLTGVISKVILGRHASLVKNRYLYLGITEYDRRIKLAKLKNKKNCDPILVVNCEELFTRPGKIQILILYWELLNSNYQILSIFMAQNHI